MQTDTRDFNIVRRGELVYTLDEMTADELRELELLLVDDLTSIKDSLGRSQATLIETGVYADPDWFRRANTARRIKGRQLEQVQRLRKDAVRRDRANHANLAEYFMDAARRVLNERAFQTVYDEAEALREAAKARRL